MILVPKYFAPHRYRKDPRPSRNLPRPTLRSPTRCPDLLHDTIRPQSRCQAFCAHGLLTFPMHRKNGTRANTSHRWHRSSRNMRCTASSSKLDWTTKSMASESEKRRGSGSQSTRWTTQNKQQIAHTTRAITSL
jgi:hypothetical protein